MLGTRDTYHCTFTDSAFINLWYLLVCVRVCVSTVTVMVSDLSVCFCVSVPVRGGSADCSDAVVFGVSEPPLHWHALSLGCDLWRFHLSHPHVPHLPILGHLGPFPAHQLHLPHCGIVIAPLPQLHIPRAGPLQHHARGYDDHSRSRGRVLYWILGE